MTLSEVFNQVLKTSDTMHLALGALDTRRTPASARAAEASVQAYAQSLALLLGNDAATGFLAAARGHFDAVWRRQRFEAVLAQRRRRDRADIEMLAAFIRAEEQATDAFTTCIEDSAAEVLRYIRQEVAAGRGNRAVS